MISKSDEPLTLDVALERKVRTQIYILLDGIRTISSILIKEDSSNDQNKADMILGLAHEIHWKFQDLTLLKPAIDECSPSLPDQTTTVLDDTLDDDGRRGLQNTELGRQILQDCPDLLQLTLCYRELYLVLLVIRRLLYLLSLLQKHGTIIAFSCSTEEGENFNSILLQMDCRNENLVNIQNELFFSLPLPYQDRGKWHDHYISGLEFAIARSVLKRIGGDFLLEKEEEQLIMTLEIPSLKEGKPDLLTMLFPKDFPPTIKSNG